LAGSNIFLAKHGKLVLMEVMPKINLQYVCWCLVMKMADISSSDCYNIDSPKTERRKHVYHKNADDVCSNAYYHENVCKNQK
jgi:hypothetical protein